MAKQGRRVYYELSTGNCILITAQVEGDFIPTTIDDDFAHYEKLKERVRETVGVIELEYGEYDEDFARSSGNVRVDTKTQQILFSYPDPNEPEQPPVYRPPLTEEVTALNEQIATLLIDSAAKDIRLQQQDAIIADLMLQVATLQTASGGGGA
ncbi:hypothetical protein IJ21_00260 [Paenibacillus sp. 32O-W]|uniref:hypothetical protein n=1 Tax=Paenibacillus sp. 32O-W TaxID=1695218 RepID=UPI00072184C1|nr:hypothetical protein [Paenibacillus sp. 32O-W]ALS25481.1 hypothetical protein IJ21_00260 [Paenibacillus sp. 32O-W]